MFSEDRSQVRRRAAFQGGILPPGHNCLTRRSAIKALMASAAAAALSSEVRAAETKRKPDSRKVHPSAMP